MMVSKRNLLFQVVIFRFHVKPWEGNFCISKHLSKTATPFGFMKPSVQHSNSLHLSYEIHWRASQEIVEIHTSVKSRIKKAWWVDFLLQNDVRHLHTNIKATTKKCCAQPLKKTCCLQRSLVSIGKLKRLISGIKNDHNFGHAYQFQSIWRVNIFLRDTHLPNPNSSSTRSISGNCVPAQQKNIMGLQNCKSHVQF